MGRKRAFSWRSRLLALLALAALVAGGWAWWTAQHWRPDRKAFPVQGVLVGARDGRVNFAAFHAIGARFVYLEASSGAGSRDPTFTRNLRARARQRAVGRRGAHLRPVRAGRTAKRQLRHHRPARPGRCCPRLSPCCAPPRTAPRGSAKQAVESELTTFLNQIEGHVGQPAVLMISPAFEGRYHIASKIERNLWLTRDFMQPDYGGRPWTLWTANSHYRNEASAEPVRWVVLQP